MSTDTQAIKDRLDIAQIIGEYVTLKKAGVNWKACCPFHHEKTPSFMVQPDKQFWHCFGCGKGGDVFTFIQEIEGLDFVEALKLLARRAGVEIDTQRSEVDASLRNRVLEINTAAANFFHHFLLEIPGAGPAREYLDRRGLKKQTIIDWQIGFISEQWDLLTKYLVKKGFAIDDLVSAGLTIKRDGADAKSGRGYYDRFRGRVMFPISDTHGNVVGFTGRVLVETENSGGKYVNTPETVLYEKSRILYGIHKAKTEIKSADLAILVEGQMDVIACHQAGMKNVVAASGTALTIEQVKLLKRYTSNVAMAFDADSAGQKAGKRGREIATLKANRETNVQAGAISWTENVVEAGLNVKIIIIPEGSGKDADECLKKDPAIWFDAVKNAVGVMEWYFKVTLGGLDKNDFKKKRQATEILLDEIVRIPNGVERDEWLKKLSDELSIDINVLREELKKTKIKKATSDKKVEPARAIVIPKSPYEFLVEDFWSLLLKYPENYEQLRPMLRGEFFTQTGLSALYGAVETLYTNKSKLEIDELRIIQIDTELSIDLLLLRPVKEFEPVGVAEIKKELVEILHRIKDKWREIRGRELQKEIADAEKSKDQDKITKLMSELQNLQ
ncbi:MAG: DNA primase [Patescibacteria group bacterium]